MNRIITTLLALSFVFVAGCYTEAGLRGIAPDGYVPDEPAEEQDEQVEDDGEIEDEEIEADNEEDEVEDEEIEDDDEEDEVEDDDEEDEVEDDNEEDEVEEPEAEDDNDTFDDPLFFYSFLGSGTQDNFTVGDDVSAPFGDVHDWVGFVTPAPQNSQVNVTLSLDCASDDLVADLYEDTNAGPVALGASYRIGCGDTDTALLDINSDYLVRIHFPYGTDAQALVEWDLEVSW